MAPTHSSRRRVLGLAGTTLAAALAGCTGDDGGTPTDGEGSTATPTTAASGDATVTVGPGGDLRFDPDSLSVDVGATVTWRWDSSNHTVTPNVIPADSDWTGTGTTIHDEGFTHSHTFEVAGRYSYYCDPHRGQGMTATLTVGDVATPTGPTATPTDDGATY